MFEKKIRVVHVINSFEFGGAETMLRNLLLRCDRSRFEPFAVALINDLTVAGPIIDAGVPLAVIGMRAGIPDPRGIMRLARHLRRIRPDVVQTWMDHSNLIGGLATRFSVRAPVIWGIHHSHHVRGLTKRSTLMTVWAGGRLSRRLPVRIIFCSDHARRVYRDDHGFDSSRMVSIPNGFDTTCFRPDAAARFAVREEIGIDPRSPLIGLVARYDPLKDHATFLRAAAVLARRRPDVQFLLCGEGVNDANTALTALMREADIREKCHLLGPRSDVNRIYCALDILASSSVSEAFPLVVGEAMASGVPCVVTDVGDSARIVGLTGHVVPPSEPEALAMAWDQMLSMSHDARTQLGAAARQRVCQQFDLTAITQRYEALYTEVATPRIMKREPWSSSLGRAQGYAGKGHHAAAC